MRNLKLLTYLIVPGLILFLQGCVGPTLTKKDAFPNMYTDIQPKSILVVPAINRTSAADASEYYGITISPPLSNYGYYIYPLELITAIFNREGIVDSSAIADLPASVFKEKFGANSVLFVSIEEWDTSYYVIGGNVRVAISFKLKSTETEEVIWSYYDKIIVDTSGGLSLVGLIETALKTALTQYIPIAKKVNGIALTSLPFGVYHPEHGKDASLKVVSKKKQEKANN